MRVYSKNVMLPGVVGRIEATVDHLTESTDTHIAICCHPHPQHGGAMDNKVVYTASRSLASLGVSSVRFNFRGVGKSDGEYAHGAGEQKDLAAVAHWCRQQYPGRSLILCGFSFGAYISVLQANQLNARFLISIAPPIGRIEFTDLQPPECSWLIIQGEEDELVDAAKVEAWAAGFSSPPQLILMPEASHFFHRKLLQLRSCIESFAQPLL